eukprot:scaffold14521_cov73-Phaeocystis_antarctica.AAC.4
MKRRGSGSNGASSIGAAAGGRACRQASPPRSTSAVTSTRWARASRKSPTQLHRFESSCQRRVHAARLAVSPGGSSAAHCGLRRSALRVELRVKRTSGHGGGGGKHCQQQVAVLAAGTLELRRDAVFGYGAAAKLRCGRLRAQVLCQVGRTRQPHVDGEEAVAFIDRSCTSHRWSWGFFPLVLAVRGALEPFLADDEALHISEVRGAACNHPFVAAHAGPRTARVAAVVVVGPVPTAPAALGCFG